MKHSEIKRHGILNSGKILKMSMTALAWFILFSSPKAQLNINTSYTAAQLMNSLVGPGVIPSNPVLNCPALASAYFSNGSTTNIGLNSGVLLTSGDATLAVGPNTIGSQGAVNNGASNDPQLNAIAATTTYDACILEFDIIATCDTVQIDYVFASEEYPEYVGSINDGFGLWINGPGYAGLTNIAVVPGTATPVTINNVSPVTNSIYYVDNTGGTSIQYDGFTVRLTAYAPVVPCSTYHVKFAVGDAVDQVFDSAVFIEEIGFKCTSSAFDIVAVNDAYEGCINGQFNILRSGVTTNTDTAFYQIVGTATNGTDYGPVLGYSVFTPGTTSNTVIINAIQDYLPEGTETVMFILLDTLCGTAFTDTAIINIIDPALADAGPDQSFCSDDTINVGVAAVPGATYAWSPTTGLSNSAISDPQLSLVNGTANPVTTPYIVTLTDSMGCVDTDTALITVSPYPTATFNLVDSICSGNPAVVTYTGSGNASSNYTWNFTGSPNLNGSGMGPYTATWTNTGWQYVTLQVVVGGCSSLVNTDSVNVLANPTVSIAGQPDQCIVGNSFDFVLNGFFDPVATFSWSFLPDGNPMTSNIEEPQGVTFPTSGVKMAVVQAFQYGCPSNIDTITFTVIPQPDPNWASLSGPQCFNGNSYSFAATGNNGPTAVYQWSFQNGVPSSSSSSAPSGISFTQPGQQNVTLIVTENNCSDTLTAPITVNPNPIVDAGPDVNFCEGTGGAMLLGTGSNGTPIPPGNGYYWTWWCDTASTWCGLDSVFDNDPLANPGASTMFYTQIVDFNGCQSNIDSAFVTIIPKPIVDAGPDFSICADSAPCVILAPTISNSPGPFSYLWSPSDGLNDPTLPNPCARPDTTTIYGLEVIDLGTGCSSQLTMLDTTATVTVVVEPLPIANAGPDTSLCLGESIMLQGYGYGAGPVYNFEWSPANGVSNVNIANPTVSPAATTDYVLTVWSNSCPSIGDTVEVFVHTVPTVDAGPDVEICLGETALLDASASGDPFTTGYDFVWTPVTGVIGSATVEDLQTSPTGTTTYYVTATSDFNCTSPMDSATVYVKPTPFAEAGPSVSICAGDSVQLNGSYYYTSTDTASDPSQIIFTWSPNSNISNTAISNPTVWPSQSGQYYLQLNYNTCSTMDSVFVNVSPQPDAWVLADTNVICQDDSVQIMAGGGGAGSTFTWTGNGLSSNQGNPVYAAPDSTTTYTVTVTRGQCSDTASVTLNVIPRPEMGYMSSLTTGCPPFDVSFLELSDDVIFYSWDFGDGSVSNEPNPIHTYTQSGTFLVTLTGMNSGACSDKVATITVEVHDTASADFTSNPDYPVEMSLPNTLVQFTDKSQNAITWNWNFGDGITSSEINPSHIFVQEGNYFVTLTVTNDFGCISRVSHGPYVILSPDLFIPNVFTPNDDNINDIFQVKYTGSQPFLLNIHDRWGNLVFSERNKYTGWDGRIKSQPAPEGVYFYSLTVGDQKYAGEVTLVR